MRNPLKADSKNIAAYDPYASFLSDLRLNFSLNLSLTPTG